MQGQRPAAGVIQGNVVAQPGQMSAQHQQLPQPLQQHLQQQPPPPPQQQPDALKAGLREYGRSALGLVPGQELPPGVLELLEGYADDFITEAARNVTRNTAARRLRRSPPGLRGPGLRPLGCGLPPPSR